MRIINFDTFHDSTLNAANYNTGLRSLYKKYNDFEKKAHSGNNSALAIIIDLKTALEKLNANQQYVIKEVLINGNTIINVAQDMDKSSDYIYHQIKAALKKASKLLCNSNVYKLSIQLN